MSSIDIIAVVLLPIYYIVCFLYFFYVVLRAHDRRELLNLIIMVLIPFSGMLLVWMVGRKSKKLADYTSIFEKFEKEDDIVMNAPKDDNTDSASVLDVLKVNDANTRRRIVFDIFKSDSKKFVRELKMALDDPDTEVSHYASSALTEIRRKFDNSVLTVRASREREPDNAKYRAEYIRLLHDYIACDILDKLSRKKFLELFCTEMSECFTDEMVKSQLISTELYKAYLMFLCELERTDEAVDTCKELLSKFDDSTIYFAVLEVYYKLDRKSEFFDTVARIRKSRVMLTQEELSTLRYFMNVRR